MDPVTLFATATALWSGVKKAVEFGREAQDILGQLSQWAQAVDNFDHAVQQEKKKPALFKKLKPSNATAEAFDEYTARVKLREQESEIRHLFLYGALNHLGMDGLREFYEIRRKIREKRIREIQDQKFRREQFVEQMLLWGMIVLVLVAGGLAIWGMLALVMGD
jgi:DNA-binding FrmR family transcriptional regulator